MVQLGLYKSTEQLIVAQLVKTFSAF